MVSKARALKAQYKLANKKDAVFYVSADAENAAQITANAEKLKRLAGAAEIKIKAEVKDCPAAICELGTIYLDLTGSVDSQAEKQRLEKEKAKIESAIKSTAARLSNEAFISKAPQSVIDGAKKQLEENKAKLEEIEKLIALF